MGLVSRAWCFSLGGPGACAAQAHQEMVHMAMMDGCSETYDRDLISHVVFPGFETNCNLGQNPKYGHTLPG